MDVISRAIKTRERRKPALDVAQRWLLVMMSFMNLIVSFMFLHILEYQEWLCYKIKPLKFLNLFLKIAMMRTMINIISIMKDEIKIYTKNKNRGQC